MVSRQHRMLVRSKVAERMFGRPDALVSAIKLTALPGIYVDDQVEEVEYFHILFDQHEIVWAEGAPSESMFAGPEALKSIPAVARHLKNAKALCDSELVNECGKRGENRLH